MNLIKKITVYPMLVIFLAASFQFYKYVLQVYPGVMHDQLMSEFNLTGGGLGNLAASFYYTFIIAQLFVGLLLDKYGARWMTTIAILMCASGVVLFSFSHNALSACLCRALIGIGVAFSSIAYMKLAAEFSVTRYAFVTGFLATATMCGAIFGELPLSYFINIRGWRSALFMLGMAGFLLAFIFFIVVRDKGMRNPLQSVTFNQLSKVIKNKKNWLLTLYGGLAFSPLSVFAGLWGNTFLQQAYHFNKVQAASMISLIFLGLGVGSPLFGFLATKTEKKLQMILYGTFIAFISLTFILFFQPLPKLLLEFILFIFGFALGTYLLVFAVAKEVNKTTVAATVFAMINAGDPLFTGITEPLIGKLLDFNWNGEWIDGIHSFSVSDYRLALILLPLYLLIATLLILSLIEKPKKVSDSTHIPCGEMAMSQTTCL